jgi:hypothetical protein
MANEQPAIKTIDQKEKEILAFWKKDKTLTNHF